MPNDHIVIDRLRCSAIIGIDPAERDIKQEVLISVRLTLDLAQAGRGDSLQDSIDYRQLARQVFAYVENSNRFIVEALATDVAGICLAKRGVEAVTVTASKPAAAFFAESIEITIERKRTDLEREVYVGMGSNSNAPTNLRRATCLLSALGFIEKMSSVYESAAVGEPGAAKYFNAVCVIRTCLPALEIRNELKNIESALGRQKGVRPVPIDLDLCLLGNEHVVRPDFRVPHRDVDTRYYLAAALCEIDPELRHPTSGEGFGQIAERLAAISPETRRVAVDLSCAD